MLFTREFLDGLADGRFSLAFRRWNAPRVRRGSHMRTAIGLVQVDSVERVTIEAITEEEAKQAGFASRAALIEACDRFDASREARGLAASPAGDLYRVSLRLAGPDPRVALRAQPPSLPELHTLVDHLARLDAAATRAGREPWTARILTLIAEQPEGTRAARLAERMGMETQPFKLLVRKLKEHGLTESLEVGYRLSPRGRALLTHLAASSPMRTSPSKKAGRTRG